MKILLTTLNSKYVHSSLALKYLYTVVAGEDCDCAIREFTINNNPDYIYGEIMRANYDLVCFSCYVWNIEMTSNIARDLKAARPEMKILLGGPEVSFNGPEFMQANPWVDYVIKGEGEYPFYRLVEVLNEESGLMETVPGLIYRKGGIIYVNPEMEPMNLNSIPFPYSFLPCEKDKVIYYESSRGCPYSCSYCLSSIDKRLRLLDMDRVKADLGYFLFKKVMQVKFVDRTFNFDKERAYEILKYIIDNDNGVTNFHFEICAELLDDKTIRLLSKARRGLIQLEAGIQSVNPETLKAVNRSGDTALTLKNIERIMRPGNIHVHVDLIAGLPYETYELFAESFNKAYALKCDMLQLGFLKLLKGTAMMDEAFKYGMVCRSRAPYEILYNDFITAEELVRLKQIEDMLDIFYNRGGFEKSIEYLMKRYNKGAFRFYEKLAEYYYEAGYQNRDRKKDDQYRILRKFASDMFRKRVMPGTVNEFTDYMDFDMIRTMNPENYKRFMNKGWELEE